MIATSHHPETAPDRAGRPREREGSGRLRAQLQRILHNLPGQHWGPIPASSRHRASRHESHRGNYSSAFGALRGEISRNGGARRDRSAGRAMADLGEGEASCCGRGTTGDDPGAEVIRPGGVRTPEASSGSVREIGRVVGRTTRGRQCPTRVRRRDRTRQLRLHREKLNGDPSPRNGKTRGSNGISRLDY
jgi:hypothetical protein